MAARMRRLEPISEMGLMPMPEPSRMGQPISARRNAASLSASGRALLDLVAGVDVLGVLAEDDHVHELGVEHGRGDAGEPAHRAQADVEVQDLAQGDVERADTAAYRRGERALDADQVLSEGVHRFVGQPAAGLVERLLPGQHLFPGHFVTMLGRGGIENQLGGRPDVDAGAVALDERDDGFVGDDEVAVVAHADEICHSPDAMGRRRGCLIRRGQGGGVPLGAARPGARTATNRRPE